MFMHIYKIKEREIFDKKDGTSYWVDRERFYQHKAAAEQEVTSEKSKGLPGSVIKNTETGFEAYDKTGRLVFEMSISREILQTLEVSN